MKNLSFKTFFSINKTDQDVKEDNTSGKLSIENTTLRPEVLEQGEVPKVKKKPLPLDLKYEPPQKKGKESGKWLDILK